MIRLVVLHDGRPFSTDNLSGLCDIGKSDKTDDLNQIGEFGVGFKSVFGICKIVRLYSHPNKIDRKNEFKKFAVEIRDFTHPVDIDDKQVPDKYTTMFEFPYSVDNAFSGFQTTEELNRVLSGRLQNLGITTLLFMKNLQSIEYEINLPDFKAAGEYLLDKKTISDHCSLVSATGKTKGEKETEDISYLVFSRPVKGIQAGRTIDIAFAVNVKDTGEYSFVPAKSPYISVYFPTETESKLKFIVQGPYRTTPNRSSVPADDKDNIELAKQTAELLRESVIELRDSGKLNFSLLNILPIEENAFENALLFKCMFSATEEMLKEEALLPCKDGTYASAGCVKIARGADFADILSDDQHIKDLKQLLYYLDYPEYKDDVKGLIKKYLKIRCIKDGEKICVKPYEVKIYFPVNSEGMSIEKYYSHIVSYPYIDMEFYNDISENSLKALNISEEVAIGLNKESGEYNTGNPGRQPKWQTSGFLWKLSLDKLDAVLEYISGHPEEPDSMAKSSFIFRFLQNHEEELFGDVSIGGNTPDIKDTYSDIVTKLRMDDPYRSEWNGKWLYTESGELVSQSEITKRDLNPKLYGVLKPDSELYEILGFRKSEEDYLEETAKKYDCLDDKIKNYCFERILQCRYGLSVADMDEKFGPEENSYVSILFHEKSQDFEFPSANVKNWYSLRKHVAEVLVFASPVKYEYKVRRIRASRPDKEIAAYLRGMYRVNGVYKYACQMCHEPFSQIEKCQLMADMEDELDAMYLCMCPNCAAEYRRMRTDEYELQNFLDRISEMEEREISSQDPVKVDFGNESICFTQTHIAEIRELMILQEKANQLKE